MNEKLLLDLFHIPSQSGSEDKVQRFIIDFLKKHQVEFEVDDHGNIYNISQKDRPLLSAHMDTVQDNFDVLMSKFIKIQDGIVKGYGVIGGDDKCGIYVILDLIENGHRDFNFVFSVQEEVGGIGISKFVMEQDLSHILWGLVLDRRGSGDILCSSTHDYGTEKFEKALLTVGESFGFSVGTGTFSDADYLSEQISCANISVGYYNQHYKDEFVVLSELKNTIDYVHFLVKHLNVKFEAPEKSFSYSRYYLYEDFDDYSRKSNISGSEDVCDICGLIESSVVSMQSVGFKVCRYCREDMLSELEEEFYHQYVDDMDGSLG